MTTARTERPAVVSRPDPEQPHHGFATSNLLILLALIIMLGTAAAYIVGHLCFRGLRRVGHPQPERP